MLKADLQTKFQKKEMRENLVRTFEVLEPAYRNYALSVARGLKLAQEQTIKNTNLHMPDDESQGKTE